MWAAVHAAVWAAVSAAFFVDRKWLVELRLERVLGLVGGQELGHEAAGS